MAKKTSKPAAKTAVKAAEIKLTVTVKKAIQSAVDADTTATHARENAVQKLVEMQTRRIRSSAKGAVNYKDGALKNAAVYVAMFGEAPGSRKDMTAVAASQYDAVSWIVRKANARLVDAKVIAPKEGSAGNTSKGSRKRSGPTTTKTPTVQGNATPNKVFKSIKGFDMNADHWRELADLIQQHADLLDMAEAGDEA